MRYGTVVQFFPAKGFGFIRPDVGPDVFFHVSALGACEPVTTVPHGQAVKYELIPGTEPKRRRKTVDDEPLDDEKPVRPQAQLVEFIDRIPGAKLGSSPTESTDRHPRSRRKKPTWRR